MGYFIEANAGITTLRRGGLHLAKVINKQQKRTCLFKPEDNLTSKHLIFNVFYLINWKTESVRQIICDNYLYLFLFFLIHILFN